VRVSSKCGPGLAVCFALACAPCGSGEAPTFAAEPTISKDGGNVGIRFTASAPTDCAVCVLDAKGRVVRHLAAGLLGPNAPPPLRKNALAQSLAWDGKDDTGRPAEGGPFQIKVGLGLRPTLDRFIGHNPDALGGNPGTSPDISAVRALATGPKGELFVFHHIGELHGGEATTVCSVLDRDGKYLRTVLPYPADLPEEKLRGAKRLRLTDGRSVPFIYQGDVRGLVPGGGYLPRHRAVVTKDGRLAFVGLQEWLRVILRYPKAGIAQVVALDTGGGIPAGGVLGPRLSQISTSKWPHGGCEDRVSRGAASLAASPDGRTLYAAGYREGDGRRYGDKPVHAVLRCGWRDPEARIFIGHKTEPGAGPNRLNTPMSLAVDKDGNIHVADRGNNRVAVFKPDGSHLGELKVEQPDRVEVHPVTGAIYVLGGSAINRLHKFASWTAPRLVAQATLPCAPRRRGKGGVAPVMALDASAEPPVLWFTPPANGECRYSLLRLEDRGTTFGKPVDVGRAAQARRPAVGALIDLTLDRERERLYAGWRKVKGYVVTAWDGRTGKLLTDVKVPRLRGGTGDIAVVGLDGKYYTVHGARGWRRPLVARFGGDLRPLPFPDELRVTAGNAHVHHRGLAADHRGNLYVLWDKSGLKERRPGEAGMANNLVAYDRNGKLLNRKLVDSDIRGLNSVRVDYAGNLYLAVGVRPAGKSVPDAFRGTKLGVPAKVHVNAAEMNWYPLMYGCIVKFGPEGGAIRKGVGGVPTRFGVSNKTEIKGAKWIHYGASVVPSWRTGPPYDLPDTCLCESPWFDVDGFGRSFFPDACRFRVGVLDTAGNLICTFGSYGNQDARRRSPAGTESAATAPAIPFYWPQAVAAGDEAAYVADRLNRRVVRVTLGYRAEVVRPVP